MTSAAQRAKEMAERIRYACVQQGSISVDIIAAEMLPEIQARMEAEQLTAERLSSIHAEIALGKVWQDRAERAEAVIAEIDDALGNGCDEQVWPAGLTRAQAIARLLAPAARESTR